MAVVQCFVAVMMFSTHLGLSSPVGKDSWSSDRQCKTCPPGQFRESCAECASCRRGTYTSRNNTQDSCSPCSRDCDPAAHLKVVKVCTSTSDLECHCEVGFRCTDTDAHTGNCRACLEIPDTVRPVLGQVNQTQISPRHDINVSKACLPPNRCSQQVAAGNGASHPTADKGEGLWLTVIYCVVSAVVFLLILIIFVYVQRSGDETCFKQAISKLCNERGDKKTRQHPGTSVSMEQQPLPAANLGPVHVHSAGTVIFSYLSQFTGYSDGTSECDSRTQKEGNGEEGRGFPPFHPTRSPSVHLSQEERSGEVAAELFPSQEQGKDWHMSKEEVQ